MKTFFKKSFSLLEEEETSVKLSNCQFVSFEILTV